MRNLITDIPGVAVGNAHDSRLATGVTALIFDRPAVASVAIHGGAPGVRDTALLEPEMSVEAVDALVLSGGSAFGLDSMGGVMAHLRALGRGFRVRDLRVPIVPGAVIFDLLAGGARDWAHPPWWELGRAAAQAASADFALGTAGAGYGATTQNVKGGLGSSSGATPSGFLVGALVVVNAVGSALIGDGPHFWAAPHERAGEFGGLGWPARIDASALSPPFKGDPSPSARENTTIAIVATDAALSKAQAKRIAVMAHDGLARALRPAHAPMDGDVTFAAATGGAGRAPDLRELAALGHEAAECLARAVARAVFEAHAPPGAKGPPAWRDLFGQ
ncbi:MAG: putative enzyme [Hyphomicrobiales bacterium]|nr:putative enzyme [Hyphomicrobiales bacterium]